MRYSLEETMGEQAFIYLEQIHSPIFLVHASGRIKKINEAGRKLLSIANINIRELEELIRVGSMPLIYTRKCKLKVFKTVVGKTDYTLIEIVR